MADTIFSPLNCPINIRSVFETVVVFYAPADNVLAHWLFSKFCNNETPQILVCFLAIFIQFTILFCFCFIFPFTLRLFRKCSFITKYLGVFQSLSVLAYKLNSIVFTAYTLYFINTFTFIETCFMALGTN